MRRIGRACAMSRSTPSRPAERLDQFLLKLFGTVPRSRVYRLVRKGEVRVNGRRADPAQRLLLNDKVRVPPVRLEPEGGSPRVPRALLEALRRAIIVEDDQPARHRQARRDCRARRQRCQLRDHRGAARAAARGSARTRASPRPRHERLSAGRAQERARCARCTRCCARDASRSAISRSSKGHWQHGRTRIDVPLRTDIRVGGERTVQRACLGQGGAARNFTRCNSLASAQRSWR